MEGLSEGLVEKVFWNVGDILAVNTRLRDSLNKRQKAYAVVETIGDILLEHVPNFEPFVKYGAHQLYGKFEFEREKTSNPAFAQFVEVRVPFLHLSVFADAFASRTPSDCLHLASSN